MSAKVSLPTFRISGAALGRRLATVILKAREAALCPEEFIGTVNAVFNSCVSEHFTPDPADNVDMEILSEEQSEIEKSVRRSAAARLAAAPRRQRKQQEERDNTATAVAETEVETPVETTEETPQQKPLSKSQKRRRNRRLRKMAAQQMNDLQKEGETKNPENIPLMTDREISSGFME